MDNKAMKMLSRGIKTSEDIANQINNEAPATLNKVNNDIIETLDKLTGRKLDVNKAVKNQQERLGNYLKFNGDEEVLNLGPTRE